MRKLAIIFILAIIMTGCVNNHQDESDWSLISVKLFDKEISDLDVEWDSHIGLSRLSNADKNKYMEYSVYRSEFITVSYSSFHRKADADEYWGEISTEERSFSEIGDEFCTYGIKDGTSVVILKGSVEVKDTLEQIMELLKKPAGTQ